MSQEELAQRIHMSRATLGKIERATYHSSISLDTLLDITDALGIDLNMLLSVDSEEKQYFKKLINTKN